MSENEGLLKKKIKKVYIHDPVSPPEEEGDYARKEIFEVLDEAAADFYLWLHKKPEDGGSIVDIAILIQKWFGVAEVSEEGERKK